MLEEKLSFETPNIKDVEGVAKILQSILPSLGYKPVPSPGVIIQRAGIDNRTYHFESSASGCYYEFDLEKGKYRAIIQFKNFPEMHYGKILQDASQKFPQFFLSYASK